MTGIVSSTDFGLAAGDLVLDVGCADGRGTARLAEQGYDVVGVEVNAALLQAMRDRPSTRGMAACRGDATALPIATSSVSGVVMIEVLEHIPDTSATIAEIRRVLKPGGRVCIAVPTAYTERLFDRLHPRYLANAEHLHRFDRRSLSLSLEQAGIHVCRVATSNLAPATAWLIHSLFRTDADATGRVLRREWIGRWTAGAYFLLRRAPLVRWLIVLVEKRIGKSWYFYGVVR